MSLTSHELIDDYERRRRGVLVKGAISMMLLTELFSVEEVQQRHSEGLGTPLDLMPHEYWQTAEGYPRFGEDILGKDF